MSVYVTEAKRANKSRRWHWPFKAYLFGDSRTELHDFAHALGLRSYTFINRPHFPCYPITICKRFQAIDRGAIPLTDRAVIDFKRNSTLSLEVQVGNSTGQ